MTYIADGSNGGQQIILDIWKEAKSPVWSITYQLPHMKSSKTTTIGLGGSVTAGPRLDELMTKLGEGKGLVRIPWKILHKDTEIKVRALGDTLLYVELSVGAYKEATTSLLSPSKTEEKTKNGYVLELIRDTTTLVVGKVLKVRDGDTIDLEVKRVSSSISDEIKPGSFITVRFAGIQTPETYKKDNSHVEDNTRYAKKFGVTEKDVLEVAEEAKEFVSSILLNCKYVVVDIDTNEDGSLKKDIYGRYLGMVYATPFQRPEDVFNEKIASTTVTANINKTLVATESKKHKKVPLAIVYGTDNKYDMNMGGPGGLEEYTKFDYALWTTSIAVGAKERVEEIDKEAKRREGEQIAEAIRMAYAGQRGTVEYIKHVVEAEDTVDTLVIRYGIPADVIANANNMSVEELIQKLDPYNPNKTGQVINIPNIQVNKDGAITYKTQSKGQYIDNTNQVKPVGRDESLSSSKSTKGAKAVSTYSLRIGDCRFVIPPLAIQVNRTSHLEKIKTLRSKSSIITKAGSSTTTITLQLYFHDLKSINGTPIPAYDEEVYYIDGLRSLVAQFQKAPFLPIENEYINEVLGIHAVALMNLTVTTVPGFPRSLSATLTMAKFEHQAYMPQVEFFDEAINYPMFRWYYQQNLKYRSPYRTYLAPIQGELTNDFMFQIADESVLQERQQAIQQLRQMITPAVFKSQVESGNNLYGKMKKDKERLDQITKQYAKYLELKREKRKIAELNPKAGKIDVLPSVKKEIYGTTNLGSVADAYFHPPEMTPLSKAHSAGKKTGWAVITLEAPANQRDFAKYKLSGNRYAIPMTVNMYDPLNKRAKEADTQVKAWTNNYYKLKEQVEMMEGEIPLIDWPIDDLILTGISVMYENSFSSAQLQMMDSPTLQYLGCQDPYIQLTFEATSRDAVASLQELLTVAEEFSRKYRYGITSGFLGFKNQLAALFGVTTVLPENVIISTVPGYVNRFKIEMVLCGFNKTQKRMESLEGFSSASSTKKDDRHVSKNPEKKDIMVFEDHLRRMEVYPDLELPTYAELNEVLPKLKAGITYLSPKNGGTFVDPDFYVATSWTFRQLIESQRNNSKGEMKFMDWFEETASTKITNDGYNMFEFSEETLVMMKTIDERTRSIRIADPPPPNSAPEGGQAAQDGFYDPSLEGADSGGLPTSRTEFNDAKKSPSAIWAKYKSVYDRVPTFNEWASMYGVSADGATLNAYNSWVRNLRNPSTKEVYQEIYRWVDYYFKNEYVDDRGKLHLADYQVYTYANTTDWYICSYNYHAKRFGVKPLNKKTRLSQSLFNKFEGKPTRERIANYIKTIFDNESGWQQFYTKGGKVVPKKNPNSSAIGIGQIMLSSHAKSLNQARRLAWDWKYNIEYAIGYFYEKYMQAKNPSGWLLSRIKEGNRNKIELVCRPLDWAVRAYEQGNPVSHYSKPSLTGKLVTPYYQKFLFVFEGAENTGNWSKNRYARYNNYNARYASPIGAAGGGPVDKDIYQAREGKDAAKVIGIVEGDRKTLIKEICKFKPDHSKVKELIRSKGDAKIRKKFIKLKGTDKINDMNIVEGGLNAISKLWGGDWFGKEKNRKATLNEMVDIITKSKSMTEKVLSDKNLFSDKEIKKLYRETIADFANPKTSGGLIDWKVGLPGTAEAIGADSYDPIMNYQKAEEFRELQNEEANRLVVTDNPSALFKDSFADLIEYDQRGRLIRAFPTFQMFIIDEGRWMSNYRLWDNFYGFNAIQSIDIHRSRKIAADTAVIRMTNVYQNLTSVRLDTNFDEWSWNLWDNLIKGEPNQELLDARNELARNMMLQTGARIHLRLGYSSNAAELPIVFNGTITEISTEDIVEVIAQGDGLELTSVISADPDDTNDGGLFRGVIEPRDLLCKLLTSKGNWLKDFINYTSDGAFFKDHPLGIMHFGAPVKVPWAEVEFNPFNKDFNYSEATQNIYSTNGHETFSQWVFQDGEPIDTGFAGFIPWFNAGDEVNIEINLYGMTTWDVAQTLAYCTPDYIAAVHPFETRSTLFFGKPYYKIAYAYEKVHKWNPSTGELKTTLTAENRKPFMQYRLYNSYFDIIQNRIKASEEGMYTNVVVRYDGKTTDVIQADFDIRYDKQRTAVVDAPIVGGPLTGFFTKDRQALYYGCSTLRDYMKDMYKGELVVMGDPTVKPYDMCFLADEVTTMNGPFLVKAVTHHFSHETGFVTSIQPDAVTVIDDQMILAHACWMTSIAAGITSYVAGLVAGKWVARKLAGTKAGRRLVSASQWTGKQAVRLISMLPRGHKGVVEFNKELRNYINYMTKYNDTKDTSYLKDAQRSVKKMEALYNQMGADLKKWNPSGGRAKASGKAMLEGIHKITGQVLVDLKQGAKIGKLNLSSASALTKNGIKSFKAARALMLLNPLSLVASLGISVGVHMVGEMFVRSKKEKQAVVVLPLYYMGREYTAGINGHRGMVVGDSPGKWDNFFMGLGFDGKGKGLDAFIGQALNLFLDGDAVENITNLVLNKDTSVLRGSVDFSHPFTYNDLFSK